MFTGTLGAVNEPFNGNNKCVSAYHAGYYESRVVDGFDRLIQKKAEGSSWTKFSITELEVWAVKFSNE